MSQETVTLFDIVETFRQLLECQEDFEKEDFEKAWNNVEGSFESKADSIGAVIKTLEGEVDILGKEIERLKSRKASREKRIADVKEYLYTAMQALNKQNVKTARFTFYMTSPQKKVDILDLDAIPKEFIKITTTPDKTKIAKALKEGANIPGATLVDGKSSLGMR